MIQATRSKSDPLSRSIALLRELHLLSVQGKDESEAADDIRSAMEVAWRNLSPQERSRLEGLSADLYSNGEDRAAPSGVSDALSRAFQSAMESQNWDAALSVLRENESKLPPADVAILRGICWDRLEQPEAASLFYAESLRIKPSDFRFVIAHLQSLVRAGSLTEARVRAREIASSAQTPYALLLAADVLFDCAIRESERPAADELRK